MEPKKIILDSLSYASIPLSLKIKIGENEKEVGSATGFLWKNKDKRFLVTNWHVLSGLDPITKKTPSDRPDFIEFPILEQKSPFIKWERFKINLYKDDDKKLPCWLIHNAYGSKVDVALLEINIPDNLNPVYFNEYPFDNFKVEISDDVFILGFPYRNTGGGNFPIWKRGSIATEPDINLDNLPKTLVDTASREGMSGSPVIFKRQGLHGLIEGNLADNSILGQISGFVGIYSGRIKESGDVDNLKAQLGIVWNKSIIQEIVDEGKFDSIENLTN